MRNKFLYQLGLTVRIWVVAVVVNALLTALLIEISNGTYNIWEMFLFMLLLGGIFSIPSVVTVFLIIRLLASLVSGIWLFRLVVTGGVTVTVFVFYGLIQDLGAGDRNYILYQFVVTIIAAVAGVSAFYKSLMKQGRECNHPQKV